MELIERKTQFHHQFPRDLISTEWPSPPHSFKLPVQALFCARRNSGKTAAAYFLCKQLKKQGNLNRLYILSPTSKSRSNAAYWRDLEVNPEDVFDDARVSSLQTILDSIEVEAEEYREYLKLKEAWDVLHKAMKRKDFEVEDLPEEVLDIVLQHEELFDDTPPTWRYMWKGKPQFPMPMVLLDDCQGSPLMHSPLLQNFYIKHRHHSYSGVSTITTVQSYAAAVGGTPKILRLNATVLALWKTHDDHTLESIIQEASEVPPHEFLKMYEFSTREKFRPLVIDFFPKEPWMRYRAGFDRFIELRTFGEIKEVAQIRVKKV